MRCVKPVSAFRAVGGGISFSRAHSTGLPIQVRCGQCVGCRMHRAREWAIRMMHEARMHDESCFLTLTYSDEHLPPNGSLRPEDHRNFLKRLRKRLAPRRIRFFHCGEYGEENLRPHFHTVVFGYAYPDRVPWSTSPSGETLYRSALLDADWSVDGAQLGHALIGTLTFESAQYVAKYTTKVLNVSKGSSEEDYRRWESRYQRVDPDTGEVVEVLPEYSTGSNRPGIGKPFFDEFFSDVFPSDEVVLDGRVMPVPRYYDKLLERRDPSLFERVKKKRLLERDRSDDSPHRLAAMETCAIARNSLHGDRNA